MTFQPSAHSAQDFVCRQWVNMQMENFAHEDLCNRFSVALSVGVRNTHPICSSWGFNKFVWDGNQLLGFLLRNEGIH